MRTDSLYGRRLGDFTVRERLDRGGFGTVYRCEQPALEREAVIKVLHRRSPCGGDDATRLIREAMLASRIEHPSAAHVYAIGVEDDGLVWIAMERVAGVTLAAWLRTHGPMPLEQFVPFFEQLADVVHAAHERGVVHRDLKPSNVMVTERAGRLFPKLLDFGVAKLIAEASDHDGIAGSPAYMAPEQWTGARDIGSGSDLYALGVIAYEALTGRRPYRADTVEDFRALHCRAPIPQSGSAGLDGIFGYAIAKRSERRFSGALALAAAFRAEVDSRMLARIRAAAKLWDGGRRQDGLLWHGSAVAELARWMDRTGAGALVAAELEFAEASRAAAEIAAAIVARRRAWAVRGGAALGLAMIGIVIGIVQYRAVTEVRVAREVATATAIESEVEQGRAALLHEEMAEAQQHLTAAVSAGDHSSATAFMLDRAMQPLHAEQARFATTAGRAWSASWSPDGTHVIVGDDKAAQIWSVAERRLEATIPHGDTVYSAVYTSDGQYVLTAGGDGRVLVARAAQGEPVRDLSRPGHLGKAPRYYQIAIAPGGRVVAATDIMGAIVDVWDFDTGRFIAELAGDGYGWPALSFSADGRWLAAGGGEDVRVFDTQTWGRVTTIAGPRIHGLAWDPVAARLLTGSNAGDASIWTVPSGARQIHLREVGEPIDAVAWAPGGALVAVAARGGQVQVFDAATGVLKSQGVALHSRITMIEFDRESHLVAAAGAGAVGIVEAATGLPVTVLNGPTAVVMSAHFDPESTRVMGAAWDGTVRIWDATSPYRRWSAAPSGDDCNVATSLVPDGRFVPVSCHNRPTRVWDTARGQLLAELPASDSLPAVSAAGDLAAIAHGNVAEIYELPGGRLLGAATHASAVTAVALGPAGQLVSGDTMGAVTIIRNGTPPIELPAVDEAISAIVVLSDGRFVVADVRHHLRVLSPAGSILLRLETSSEIGLLRPDAGGNNVVTVPVSTAIAAPVVLDMKSGAVRAQLDGHVGRVFTARWVDRDRILTTGSDGAVRMWSSTGALLHVYRWGGGFLADAALSPDGRLVVGGGAGGQLRVWDAATGQRLWTTRVHVGSLIGIHFEGEDIVTRGFDGDLARWHGIVAP